MSLKRDERFDRFSGAQLQLLAEIFADARTAALEDLARVPTDHEFRLQQGKVAALSELLAATKR